VTLSQQTASQPQRFEAILADGRAKGKAGKTSEANQELEAMLASTRKSGYRNYEYQARLELAEIELQSRSALARPHLVALEKGAREHGLLLVANHARVLAGGK
jgi:LAS superfamily LD-carboxypeptidase LdcB